MILERVERDEMDEFDGGTHGTGSRSVLELSVEPLILSKTICIVVLVESTTQAKMYSCCEVALLLNALVRVTRQFFSVAILLGESGGGNRQGWQRLV